MDKSQELMQTIYNESIFQLYLGGLFSLLLTVAVIFVRQIQKRDIERKKLEQIKKYRPEEVGDIEEKLNDSYDFRFPSVLQEITIWGIQPLFIISFVNLFTGNGETEIIIAFFLVILTLFHEFYLSDNFSNSIWYQLFVIFIWITTYLIISYRTNGIEMGKNKNKNKVSKCVAKTSSPNLISSLIRNDKFSD